MLERRKGEQDVYLTSVLQYREGEARHGFGAVALPVQRDQDHGCDSGLWRACAALQTDGKERHEGAGEPDEGQFAGTLLGTLYQHM